MLAPYPIMPKTLRDPVYRQGARGTETPPEIKFQGTDGPPRIPFFFPNL
jgi:hypothetical protein